MSISCKDIVDSFKNFKVKAITKSAFDKVCVWDTCKVEYSHCEWDRTNVLEDGKTYTLGKLEITEFVGKKPEECIYIVEEPVDYSKWVGKLCWFWDVFEENKMIGILSFESNEKFKDEHGIGFQNCRPVKPDEVKFVKED